MEPETTESAAETTENKFASTLGQCGACKDGFDDKDPKLLPCLHTFCSACVTISDTGEDNILKCPTCHAECTKDEVINNLFIEKNRTSATVDQIPTTDESRVCDGCEESVEATSYCNECSEWLCDQCVQAHRRVKMTKDHVIQPRDRALHGMVAAPLQTPKIIHCPQHKSELLKLYCETCDKLTCRDCQLSDHKDHKYHFVQEAADMYKHTLQSLLGKIKEKSTYVENAKALINKRNKEISETEKKVTSDIKMFAVKLITEVNRRGKQLLTDLQSICGAKKTQLGHKSREIETLSQAITHAVSFSEYAIHSTDQSAMLFTKGVVVNQLKKILRTRCEVPNPYHIVDIRLQADHSFALNSIPKLGTIVMDGVAFHSARNQANMPVPVPIATSSSNQLPTTVRDLQGSGGTQSQGQAVTSDSFAARSKPPGPLNLRKLNPSQREMVLNRMRQMHELKRRSQQQAQLASMSPPVSSGRPMFPTSSAGRIPQLPNQSSNISSSNHHQNLRSSNIYFPGSQNQRAAAAAMMRHSANQPLQGAMINLAQLQEERFRRMGARGTVSTTSTMGHSPSPIVIQPQQYNSPSPNQGMSQRRSPSGLPDCMQEQLNNRNQYGTGYSSSPPVAESSMKPEEIERPSCSFATIASIPVKIEPKPDNHEFGGLNLVQISNGYDGDAKEFMDVEKDKISNNQSDKQVNLTTETRSLSPGSRTPTPRIESTNQDLGNGSDQSMSERIPIEEDGVLNLSGRSSGVESGRGASSPGSALSEPMDTGHSSTNLDESEDYCGVCHNGGNLLCCDGCPKVFHLHCHVPMVQEAPSGSDQWFCGRCAKPEDLRLVAPDLRNEAPGAKRKSPAGLTVREQKVADRMLLEIMCHEASTAFHEPVPKHVPNYYKIITVPMDFSTVKHRLSKNSFNRYSSVEEFVTDCNLVYSNCAVYNHYESDVGKAGIKMKKFFDKLLKKFLPYINPRSLTPQGDADGKARKRKKMREERMKGMRDPLAMQEPTPEGLDDSFDLLAPHILPDDFSEVGNPEPPATQSSAAETDTPMSSQTSDGDAFNLSQESACGTDDKAEDEDYTPDYELELESSEEPVPKRRISSESRHSRKSTDSNKAPDGADPKPTDE